MEGATGILSSEVCLLQYPSGFVMAIKQIEASDVSLAASGGQKQLTL